MVVFFPINLTRAFRVKGQVRTLLWSYESDIVVVFDDTFIFFFPSLFFFLSPRPFKTDSSVGPGQAGKVIPPDGRAVTVRGGVACRTPLIEPRLYSGPVPTLV